MMSSETQLKIINNLMALLGYLPIIILVIISKITIAMKALLFILFLGPKLYKDIKERTFQI